MRGTNWKIKCAHRFIRRHYRPASNSIVYAVESLKRELEALGYDMYIVCPAGSMRSTKRHLPHDDHILAGMIPHEKLGVAYAVPNVFLFPYFTLKSPKSALSLASKARN